MERLTFPLVRKPFLLSAFNLRRRASRTQKSCDSMIISCFLSRFFQTKRLIVKNLPV